MPASASPLAERPAVRASPAAPPVCLRSYALAALAARANDGDGTRASSHELRFLRDHWDAVCRDGADWAQALPSYLRQPSAVDLPLLRVCDQLGLSALELLAVSLAAAVEDDVMVGRAVAYLQAPLGASRPTVGLLVTAFGGTGESGTRFVDALATGAAVESGLLTLLGEGAPLPERPVAVPLHLCLALKGA